MVLELAGLVRHYGTVPAVDGVDLTVAEGETLALLGPSGCGKSTLLRLVAGLEPPDRGAVRLGGRDLTRVPPQRRGVGMVFQDYALFPHMSVRDNVAFGLVERGWSGDRRGARLQELMEALDLQGLEDRRPHALSGGQQQRVALARALAPRPSLLLLDEPLSNLDRTLRDELTRQLAQVLAGLAVQAIHVTHDQSEAFALADRVAVMRAGRVVQVGAPDDLVDAPRSGWLARFLGLRELIPEPQARILGFPGPVLLRVERLTPDPGGRAFTVRARTRVGAELELDLHEPEWGVDLRWRARPRELTAPPEPGGTIRLRVPDDAWTVLEAWT